MDRISAIRNIEDADDARARVRDLLDEATGDADDVTFSVERV